MINQLDVEYNVKAEEDRTKYVTLASDITTNHQVADVSIEQYVRNEMLSWIQRNSIFNQHKLAVNKKGDYDIDISNIMYIVKPEVNGQPNSFYDQDFKIIDQHESL